MNKIVKRLIQQYKEYASVADEISKLRVEMLRSKMSNKRKEFDSLSAKIKMKEILQNRISDEMSFKDPIIWILYKYFAYKGTNKNMDSLYDLIQHCLPEDYVCTRRFKYLSKYIDISEIEKSIRLNSLVSLPEIKKLIVDPDFMAGWQKYEYYIEDGKIAKWKNFKG